MFAAFLKAQREFGNEEDGSVAILFALMLVVIAFAAGMALDYSRVVHSNSKLAAAADAAALAAGRALQDGRYSEGEVKKLAQAYFRENALASGHSIGTVSKVKVDIDRANSTVTFDIQSEVPMTLTRLMGPESVDLPVSSTVTFKQQDIELAMALDITGSMRGRKLADLKLAANDLLDILMPKKKTTHSVKIAVAPYAASVNAGRYAGEVSNYTSIDGCVWERQGPQAFTDAAPSIGSFLAAGAAPVDIDLTEGVSSYSCPRASITPLSDDHDALKRQINSLSAGGFTAGHIGAAWASYLISPEWATIWPTDSKPVAYSDDKTTKVVLLMTDGIFNTAYANGSSDYQATEVCQTMKQNDVLVYAIGFQAPSAAEDTLKSCATTENFYFKADDAEELRTAFISIAKQLANLRLSN